MASDEFDWLCELTPDFNRPGVGPAAEWDGNGDVGVPPTAEDVARMVGPLAQGDVDVRVDCLFDGFAKGVDKLLAALQGYCAGVDEVPRNQPGVGHIFDAMTADEILRGPWPMIHELEAQYRRPL